MGLEGIDIKPRNNKSDSAITVDKAPIKDLVEHFEERYFFTRQRKRQSKATFKMYMYFLNRFLGDYFDKPLSKELITQVISKTDAASKTRAELVKTLKVFCDAFEFQYKFSGLSKYKPRERNLPTDDEIIEAWHKIQIEKISGGDCEGVGASWGWVYGVIATYGLRPHEILAIDYEKSFQPKNYKLYINETITEGTKTGSRVVFPLHFEWVDLFDLANPKTKVLINKTIVNFSILLGIRTRQREINFPAYNLRHRYAVRGHELGVPVDDMARWMGHSIEKHTQIYQKYMKEDTHDVVYDAVLQRAEELKKIKQGRPSYAELEKKLENAQIFIAQLQTELKLTKARKSKKADKSDTYTQMNLLNIEELEQVAG